MREWNYDIEQAPSGYYEETTKTDKAGKTKTIKTFVPERCQIATKCGLVIPSQKLENGRWEFLATNEQPIAWANFLPHPMEIEL